MLSLNVRSTRDRRYHADMGIPMLTSRNIGAQRSLHDAGPCFCDIEQITNSKSIHKTARHMAYGIRYRESDLIVNQGQYCAGKMQ